MVQRALLQGNRLHVKAAGDLWPIKRNLLGIPVSSTKYREATTCILGAATRGTSALVTALAVHGLVLASEDQALGDMLRRFDLVAPDGQPLRIALNYLYGCNMRDRVYGPQLMIEICRAAAEHGLGIYLYGSTRDTLDRLDARLRSKFPRLAIVGRHPSVFRPLTPSEDEKLVERINSSGATVLFVGLGCPIQETFAYEHRTTIKAVQICVGAAFDFHAGTKRMAPAWMQDYALEWLFRLSQEPRRLFRRYAVTNTKFLVKMSAELAKAQRLRQTENRPGEA